MDIAIPDLKKLIEAVMAGTAHELGGYFRKDGQLTNASEVGKR
ncbi:MAG TPA: hypothetical protein VFE47_31530 [Tepidisphaeraceae bacterium]|jgi:hypothetical protein|nr:hypothetical protein [Tepidisphaeraceae bacterium]